MAIYSTGTIYTQRAFILAHGYIYIIFSTIDNLLNRVHNLQQQCILLVARGEHIPLFQPHSLPYRHKISLWRQHTSQGIINQIPGIPLMADIGLHRTVLHLFIRINICHKMPVKQGHLIIKIDFSYLLPLALAPTHGLLETQMHNIPCIYPLATMGAYWPAQIMQYKPFTTAVMITTWLQQVPSLHQSFLPLGCSGTFFRIMHTIHKGL